MSDTSLANSTSRVTGPVVAAATSGDPSGDSCVRRDVAIVGMACTYPGARNVEEFWRNIVEGRDCTSDAPKQRWDADVFHDPAGTFEDRVYTRRGGFLGTSFAFNPLRYGTMPRAVEGAEPDQFLVLRTVHEAMQDAGYLEREIDGTRAAFILGRGNYMGAGVGGLLQRGMMTEQALHILRTLRPDISAGDLQKIRKEIKRQLPGFGAEAAPGLIPNIVTGRVANRLDLMGPNFTVDAACASSLIATELAVRELITGRYDLMLAGGCHVCMEVPFLQVFAAMGALSRTSVIRPFDRDCDGTLAGEGVGMLVLKRREDAERDGDRIYAVIKGVGTSSDGRALGVTAPRLEGEVLALRRAYANAGVDPATVELVEAHGTGTPVGDPTEVEALHEVFGPRNGGPRTCALGSVKSMIGHTMPAAGVAGIIKTALALYHRVLPPTINCRQPLAPLANGTTRFYVNTQARPWIHGQSEAPRRAGVNAFGFGGVNAHVVMEEYSAQQSAEPAEHMATGPDGVQVAADSNRPTLMRDLPSELVVVRGATPEALRAELLRLRDYAINAAGVPLRDIAYTANTALAADDCRAAIVASSAPDLAAKLERVAARLEDPSCRQIKDAKGLYYFGDSPVRGGKMAFLFPGEGAQYVNMMADLCLHFPEVRAFFDAADRAVAGARRHPPSADIFPPPFFSEDEERAAETRLWQIERATEAVLTADGAMYLLLRRLGISPDMITGHSAGEWVAMAASGILDFDEFVASAPRLDAVYGGLADDMTIPKVAMLAVGASRDDVIRLAAQVERTVHIANDNCPHQVVIVTEPQDAEPVMKHLYTKGVFVERLPYDRGYHTPVFTYICEPLRKYFASLRISPPGILMYSSTTAQPYPGEPAAILDLVSQTFARPLLFRDTVEAMYAAGARIFLEVGPRGILTGFTDDILRGRPHASIASNQARRCGVTTLHHALAMLAALHVPMDLSALYKRRGARMLTWDATADRLPDPDAAPGTLQVSLCYPQLVPPEEGRWTLKTPESGAVRVASAITPDAPQAVRKDDPTAALSSGVQMPQTAANASPEGDLRRADHEPRVSSGNGHGHAPHAGGNGHSSGVGVPDSVLRSHVKVMESFLDAHEQVMQALLDRAAPAGGPAGPARLDAELRADVGREISASRPGSEGLGVSAEVATIACDPGPASPHAAVTAAPSRRIADVLVEIVSDRTGYPPDMLDLDLDMEADLGIDSIKRIEILGALQSAAEKTALSGEIDLEAVAKLKTLRQVVQMLEGSGGLPPSVRDGSSAVEEISNNGAGQSNSDRAAELPSTAATAFAGQIASIAPGSEVTVIRSIDLDEDLYLLDHCFDPVVSESDPQRSRLHIVPLTVSLEMMAEVASLLMPGRKVVGARGMQSARWIDVRRNGPRVELAIQAVCTSAADEIRVSLRRLEEGSVAAARPSTPSPSGRSPSGPIAEATIIFAGDYPDPPQVVPLSLKHGRKPACSAEELYTRRRMFHGPRFRGVATFEAIGENGLLAELQTLPADDLLRSNTAPQFHIDPCLLDAAGQLVGYWPVEYLDTGFMMFPIQIQECAFYRAPLPPGTRVRCQVHIREISQRQVRADIDICDPTGRLWMRVAGWTDWRFYWERGFYDFWRFPDKGEVSECIALPLPEGHGDVECRRITPMGEVSSSIWENLGAHLLLSERELAEYYAMAEGPRRTEWIFGRAAAKDAVRAWIHRRHGLVLFPADVEIRKDERGRPYADGWWAGRIGETPYVSIAHKQRGADGAVAVAVAGEGPLGVDLESIEARDERFAAAAFCSEERALLAGLNGSGPDEWIARAWSAKEAAGKALGIGLDGVGRGLVVRTVDAASGEFQVDAGKPDPSAGNPGAPGVTLAVRTVREGEYVMALAVKEDGTHECV